MQASSADLEPSTVRVQHFAVRKYLEWAKQRGKNIVTQSKSELPRVELRHRPVLPTNLFSLYFRQADLDLKEPIRTAVMLLPCCGLRAHEMVSLKLDQIHQATVKLQGGKMKTTLFLRIIGKGNKQRNVPLMEEGVEILMGYLAGWRKRQPGPWVFPKVSKKASISGKRHISDRYLRGALQKMREPLGMEFTPHTMRRTYITMLWRKRVDLRVIAEIAGHANIQTTIDHYIVMEPDDTIIAVENAGSSMMR
jgi:integrase